MNGKHVGAGEALSEDRITRTEAQSYVDDAVSRQQEQYRNLFAEFERVAAERDKYKQALQDICSMGRSPIAEGALGI